ncbi:MAG: hypothetical protein RQ750_02145 [Roseovarius sp.]|nr:hypothetical protein [Roseovarius sp.]
MRILLALTMVSSMLLAGCGGLRDSRANPANWFGKSQSRPVAATPSETVNPLIPEKEESIFRRNKAEVYLGTPIDQIAEMKIERTSDGAIIRVIGRSLRQGAFDVRLVPDTKDGRPVNGVLSYRLLALQPGNQPQGSERARTVQAAVFVSTQTLEQARTITVSGARNTQTSTR